MEPFGARWQRSLSQQNQTLSIWLLLETKKVARPAVGRASGWESRPLDVHLHPLLLIIPMVTWPLSKGLRAGLGISFKLAQVVMDMTEVGWTVLWLM